MWEQQNSMCVCVCVCVCVCEKHFFIFDPAKQVYNFSVVGLSCLSVCLSVCMYVCQTITSESLDIGSSFSYTRYILRKYLSSSYMKDIGSRSRSQEQNGRKSLFPQCKTSIGNNSDSIKHRAVNFAGSMPAWGFWDMAGRMV